MQGVGGAGGETMYVAEMPSLPRGGDAFASLATCRKRIAGRRSKADFLFSGNRRRSGQDAAGAHAANATDDGSAAPLGVERIGTRGRRCESDQSKLAERAGIACKSRSSVRGVRSCVGDKRAVVFPGSEVLHDRHSRRHMGHHELLAGVFRN